MILIDPGGRACQISRAALAPNRDGAGQPSILLRGHAMRLDNRTDLIAELSLNADVADDQILLAGWQAWGTTLADRLRGAFAFVLHDPRVGKIFAGRDIFGLSPLFYRIDDETLWIARDSRTLRSLLPDPPEQNTQMLADYVAGIILERQQTFFETVLRFPPASTLTVDRESTEWSTYWTLADVPSNPAAQAPPGAFRTMFDQAIARCFVPGKTSVLLSGGLDSSAIAGSLAEQLSPDQTLRAQAVTFEYTAGWTDASHLAAVADATGAVLHPVAGDRHDPLADTEFWLEAVDGPFLPHGHSVTFQLMAIAREAGMPIMLSGHGGDEIVSYGFGRLNELAKSRKWWAVWRESRALSGLYNESRLRLFARYLTHFDLGRKIYRRLARPIGSSVPVQASYLDPDLADTFCLGRYEVRNAANRLDHDERMLHEEVLNQPLQPISLEVYALCSAAAGTETRFPFYDRDLLEFSLGLSASWKLHGGLSRYILRWAMRGSLPESVLSRRDKFDFANAFREGLADIRSRILDLTDPSLPHYRGLVNLRELAAARERLSTNGSAIAMPDAMFLWRMAVLSLWQPIAAREPQPLQMTEQDSY